MTDTPKTGLGTRLFHVYVMAEVPNDCSRDALLERYREAQQHADALMQQNESQQARIAELEKLLIDIKPYFVPPGSTGCYALDERLQDEFEDIEERLDAALAEQEGE